MSVENKPSYHSLFFASLAGLVRTGAVSVFTHPCDVVKIRMQTSDISKNLRETLSSLYAERGISSFYTGYQIRLIKLLPQQAIAWPLMVVMPREIAKKSKGKVGALGQQVITTLVVSGVNAGTTTPFRNAIILANAQKRPPLLISFIFSKSGWKGFIQNFSQTTLSYGSFLCFQQLYSDFYRRFAKKKQLSVNELALIGIGVGVSVGLTTITCDNAYSLRIAKDMSFFQELEKGNKIKKSLPRRRPLLYLSMHSQCSFSHYARSA